MGSARLCAVASAFVLASVACASVIPYASTGLGEVSFAGVISTRQPNPTASVQAEPLSLPAQLDLARLVDLTADRLIIGIDYDPAVLKGPAVLRLPGPVNDTELWTILNRVLASRGLTTISLPGDRAYAVVKITDAAAAALTTSAAIPRAADVNPSPIPPTDAPTPGFQSMFIDLKHRDPATLVETVTKVLSKTGSSVVAIGPSKQLLISDLSPRIEQALQLLSLLDVPEARTVVERVPIANLGAEQMATLVTQLNTRRKAIAGSDLVGEVVAGPDGASVLVIAPGDVQSQWRDLIASLDQREQVTTFAYDARQFPAAEVAKFVEASVRDSLDTRWNLVLDTLTGGFVVTATPGQHARIEAILARLESVPPSARRQVRSISVQHRAAAEVLSIVERLLSAGAVDASADESTSVIPPRADARSGTMRVPGTSTSEPRSSSTSVASNPMVPQGQERGRSASEVTLTLDSGTSTIIAVGPPRLLDQIESLVRDLDVRQRQVELQVLLIGLTDTQVRNLGMEIRGQIDTGDIEVKLASLFGLSSASGDGIPPVGSPAGLSGLVLSPGEFSVLVRALETVNQGRTLSMPKVVVANNQQATVDSVLQQPFVNTNASDTVATTSFGGFQNAGTQVSLRPEISSADHVILEYSISLSAFVGESTTEGVPPPRQENRLDSVVTIPDGYTIAIGGIELATQANGESRIPLLSQIPLVGELLKNRTNSNNRQRFYAFIRPTILQSRDFADLKYSSDVATMEAGIDDGWPDLQPRMIR